jgi:putative transposase
VVVPGIPYHVTLRGNRRKQTFFGAVDYAAYRDQVAESCSTLAPSKAAVLC